MLISYETYANVKDEIRLRGTRQHQVRGIAYPVTTYRVVDLKANMTARAGAIHANTPHLRLEVQPELMAPGEREQALTALREALERLSHAAGDN